MTLSTDKSSVTFKVHEVEAQLDTKPTIKTRDNINTILSYREEGGSTPILSCSGYNSNCIPQLTASSFLDSIHIAFAEHRPLYLSPDIIWTQILQGLALHVQNNAETLRPYLVSHQGKETLTTTIGDFHCDSPESDWQSLIDAMGGTLKGAIGARYDQLMCDFSTSGPLEKTVSAIAILDTYQHYFSFHISTVCGIPSITLTGTGSDWQRLIEKIEVLKEFGLDWWQNRLTPILQQFVAAAAGNADAAFWRDIYKNEAYYDTEKISGWAGIFFPYLYNGKSGEYDFRNPMFASSGAAFYSKDIPSGLSCVPITFVDREQKQTKMQILGGFIGTEQRADQSIAARLGWAIRKDIVIERKTPWAQFTPPPLPPKMP